jgi:hypothetical protein
MVGSKEAVSTCEDGQQQQGSVRDGLDLGHRHDPHERDSDEDVYPSLSSSLLLQRLSGRIQAEQ